MSIPFISLKFTNSHTTNPFTSKTKNKKTTTKMLDPSRHELNYFVRTADTCINYLLTVHLEQCPIAELTVRPESIFYIGTAKSPLCCNKLTVVAIIQLTD